MSEPIPIGESRCDTRKPEKIEPFVFELGDRVKKIDGDYKFSGWIAGLIRKRSGVARYAVENDDGVLFIHKAQSLAYENETLAT